MGIVRYAQYTIIKIVQYADTAGQPHTVRPIFYPHGAFYSSIRIVASSICTDTMSESDRKRRLESSDRYS